MYCSNCGAKNPGENRFCGMCGARLLTPSSGDVSRPQREAPANVTMMPREPQRPVPLGEVLAEKRAAEQRRHEREMERYIGEAPRTVAPPSPPPPRKDVAPAHLGGPSFLGLNDPEPSGRSADYLLEDDDYRPRRSYGRFLVLLLVLAAFAGLGYLQWQRSGGQLPSSLEQALGQEQQSQEQAATDPEAPAPDAPATPADAGAAQAAQGPPPVNPESATPAPEQKSETAAEGAQPAKENPEDAGARADVDENAAEQQETEAAPAEEPQKPKAGQREQAEAEFESVAGERELELGRAYLSGRYGERDAGEAAKWLWKAVSKGNNDASLALADLYMSGEGVEKNCEQARVLLTAAARKGNADAASKLRTVQCE